MRAAIPFVSFLLVGCGTFGSSADEQAADSFWENADLYYRGKDYARSQDQVRRGLERVPDHYKLNLLEGALLLQRARRQPEFFERALTQLEKVRDLRNPDTQDHAVWIGLGRAHQGLYQLHRRQARALRAQAEQTADPSRKAELQAQAEEHLALFHEHLKAAENNFRTVADLKQRQSFLGHEELCMIEIDKAWELEGEARRRQLAKAAEQAKLYLKENTYRQKHYTVMLDITGRLEQEETARRNLRDLRSREGGFRASYANLLYKLGSFTEARKQLDRVLEIDPTRAADYFNRARCRVKLGESKLARQDLEHFLRLTKLPFDAPEVKEATKLLGEVRG